MLASEDGSALGLRITEIVNTIVDPKVNDGEPMRLGEVCDAPQLDAPDETHDPAATDSNEPSDVMTNKLGADARVFIPLSAGALQGRVFGGRGSGKSHFFGERPARVNEPGLRAVCIREVQKTLAQSSKRQIEQKIAAFGAFRVLEDRIIAATAWIIFQGMQDHTGQKC